MRRINKIHLLGIGGSGMSGIAEVLLNIGYKVSGSDITKSTVTERLNKLGIKITYAHLPENVVDCDAVIVSSAIGKNNLELLAAYKRRIPVVPRAEMLAELMRFKEGIAIAGTHGKTTTTSLIATLFSQAKLDPTFVIGGKLNSLGSNAKLGSGKYFIAEADESDASFLHLNPMISVITNIDSDHLGTYDGDFEKLKATFIEFIHRLPFYGLAVLCLDDPVIKQILPKITRPYLTYGFDPAADIRALDYQVNDTQSKFKLALPNNQEHQEQQEQQEALLITLNLPGRHNVLNALAAIAVALEVGIDLPVIYHGLSLFQGIGRRMQILGHFNYTNKNFFIMDDYGHHPKEVMMVINTVRGSWPTRRLVMVYQPHRFSRTKSLFEDFTQVLSCVDVLIMLEVYAAGEMPIVGADSRTLCGSIRKRGKVDPIFLANQNQLFSTLQNILQDGDIILMQGAGSIGGLAKDFANLMKIHQQYDRQHDITQQPA